MPDDWNYEEDGEYERPQVSNPAYKVSTPIEGGIPRFFNALQIRWTPALVFGREVNLKLLARLSHEKEYLLLLYVKELKYIRQILKKEFVLSYIRKLQTSHPAKQRWIVEDNCSGYGIGHMEPEESGGPERAVSSSFVSATRCKSQCDLDCCGMKQHSDVWNVVKYILRTLVISSNQTNSFWPGVQVFISF